MPQTCNFDEPDQPSAAKMRDLFQNKYYFEKNDKGDWVKHKLINKWMDDLHIRVRGYAGIMIVVDPLNRDQELVAVN